ncbi:MAG: NAD(+) kinase [Gammaproteobacteria bacterium]|nr:NAD(+) kinase [Gammaproteobacteria bacterium]MBT8109821.1 NAD(+) kinase [Gammaproteobacteria bacterium]NND46318.1 NAD(+) kinase [Woeseiaceae bacterium]NNL44523.1 NAD(+) kinase [Woeseiaceae bacterium]
MKTQFANIAILGRHNDPRVAEPMQELTRYLSKAGVNVFAAESLKLELAVTRMQEEDLCDVADLIIAIGGDGTMLYAGRLARESGTPILGINRGRLGFLADVTPDEMINSVEQVLHGNYTRDSRMLLEARLHTDSGTESTAFALNDVVLQRRETGRMVDFSTRIAGKFVNTHSGDGLIIATPTGSTAYALSCGGPIIEPELNAVTVVPICPHTLTDRPLVIAAEQTIEVVLLERDETLAEITVDGFSMGEIRPADRLVISAADQRITLVHPPSYDFYGILRSKLFWGRDSRNRNN